MICADVQSLARAAPEPASTSKVSLEMLEIVRSIPSGRLHQIVNRQQFVRQNQDVRPGDGKR